MQSVHIAQVKVSGRGSSGAQLSHGIGKLPSEAGASTEQDELRTNSPRSEDLCKLSGLLHHSRSVFFFASVPRGIFLQKLQVLPIFHLLLCCRKGQSEIVMFQKVARYSLHSTESVGESLVIGASRSTVGEGGRGRFLR